VVQIQTRRSRHVQTRRPDEPDTQHPGFLQFAAQKISTAAKEEEKRCWQAE